MDDRHCIPHITATQVSVVPSMNYGHHQRKQAGGQRSALALRALGMWRNSWINAARRAGALPVVSCSGQGGPRRPDSAISGYYDPASLGYTGCWRLLSREKGGVGEIIAVTKI